MNPPVKKDIPPRGKVIRDPVHGLIAFHPGDEFLLELIACPEFQRLRRVRQLGVSNITYPGAEHTRFAHSLGVLNFATRMLGRLRERYGRNKRIVGLISRHGRSVRAAALLHDTGHGPFSHMLERAFELNSKHENRTIQIISERTSSVNKTLLRHGIKPDEVSAIIDGTFPVWFLRDIVSSQLDADRMDYLLRDALMTGVEYGQYDAEWILNSICLGLDPAAPPGKSAKHLRLCLDEKRGLHAAEQLVVARMHMSYQVYFHRVTRIWEAHLLCLFRHAELLAAQRALPSRTPAVVRDFFRKKGSLAPDAFLGFDETVMLAAIHLWSTDKAQKSRQLAQLSRAFLDRRKMFDCHDYTGDHDPISASFKKVQELQKKGARDGFDFYHDDAKLRGYKDFGRSVANHASEGDDESASSEAIFLADGDPAHNAKPLEQHAGALITKALAADGKPSPLNRVFVRQEFYPQKQPRRTP